MAGLPVTSLPALGEVGGPAFQITDPAGNIKASAGVMRQDPTTGLPEPVYQQDAGGQPDITRFDPVHLATWRGEQEMQQLQVFDQQLAKVKAPLQHELDTSYKQYQIDINSIRNSGMDQVQQRQRINQINNQYNKHWVKVKSKVEPSIAAITQGKESAMREMRLNQALRMKEIQTYAGMAEAGIISPEAASSLQYKTLGIDVPITEFRPSQVQNPYDIAREMRSILEVNKNRLKNFKVQKTDRKGWWTGSEDRVYVKKQGTDGKNKGDWKLAEPGEAEVYNTLLQQQGEARNTLDVAAGQLISKRVAHLTSAADSMANSVRNALPRKKADQGRKFLPGEEDKIWEEAGGDWQVASQIARSRGIDVGED